MTAPAGLVLARFHPNPNRDDWEIIIVQRGERLHWFESNEYGWREWPLRSEAVWLLYRAGLLNLQVHQTLDVEFEGKDAPDRTGRTAAACGLHCR